MPDKPERLTLSRHRDLAGRSWKTIAQARPDRAAGLPLLLGLSNVFGQRPDTAAQASPVASLNVYSPTKLRSGLYFESRSTIDAHREIRKATLVLGPGWLEGMTLNTLEPSPIGESSRDGKLALELGHIPAGRTHLFFMHFQVNPTNVGRRSQTVELRDDEAPDQLHPQPVRASRWRRSRRAARRPASIRAIPAAADRS